MAAPSISQKNAASKAPAGSALKEAAGLLVLAGPLVANNLSIAGMGFADTVMAGRLGTEHLAAVAVGSMVWMVTFLFGLGVLMAMSPTAAHSVGAGRPEEVGRDARQCLWLSQVLALIGILALRNAGPVLTRIGVDPEVIPLTVGYLDAIAWGLPAMYGYLALRFMSEGVGWTRPIAYVAFIALIVNVCGNYVLMFGHFGFPRLGAVGCGAASAISMWVMLAFMATYVRRQRRYRPYGLLGRFDWPDPARIRALLALGLPIAVSVMSEAGLFSAVGLLMGTLGATVVAAHQIAINYSAVMFMIPLAIHSALTIRVGHCVGRGELRLARRTGFIGIAICGGFMMVSAVVMLVFRESIAGFYSTDADVRPLAASLLTMAMIFQVSDGLQVGAAGALRGYKDTRVPMLLNFGSYWGVAFPLAWYLGVHVERGPQAVWIGLIVGLTLTAVTLNARFAWLSARRLRASAETLAPAVDRSRGPAQRGRP
jgi:MATE family multidrug resistance protein